ncbi:hypothetical protein C8R47DRAFT_1062635 [Mycena vitilis]|nr:hypothetical protein C8R47DRAFT_1062635 [Mycena vitilis]
MSSPNTSPNKSFRSRMGGVMRRTSSVLAISRPSTPTPATTPAFPDEPRRSSISKSAEGRKSTTSLTPSGATPPAPVAPSEPVPQLPPVAVVAEPIAEPEPVVEAAPAPAPPPAPEPTAAPAPAPVPQVIMVEAAPVTTPAPAPTPQPQANGMGTPKAVKRLLPIAAQYQMYPSPIAESPAREAAAAAEEAERNKDAAEAAAPRVDDVAAPPADAPQVPDAPQEQPAPAAKELSPVAEEAEPAAYVPPPPMLDSSNPGAFTDEPLDMHPSEAAVVAEPVFVPAVEPVVPEPAIVTVPVAGPITVANPSPVRDERAYFDLVAVGQVHDVGAPAASPESQTVVGEHEHEHEHEHTLVEPYPYELRPAEPAGPTMPVAEPAIPEQRPRTPEQHWAEERGGEAGKGNANANEDPFADPPQERTRKVSGDSGIFVPIAIVDLEAARGYDVGGVSSVPMPVADQLAPPLGSIRTAPSAEDLSRIEQGHFAHHTDERRPLLARQPSDSYTYRTTGPGPTNAGALNDDPGFHELGWIAYVLPDVSATYYVHPTLRATTDADLRDAWVLGNVSRALGYAGGNGEGNGRARKSSGAGTGMELWLREVTSTGAGKHVRWGKASAAAKKGKGAANGKGKGKGKWRGDLAEAGLARWWVDHAKREVSAAEDVVGLEDHLDMEYRYWAFMESHPAHAALSFAARREAMDVLTWAWTDRLLPPQQLPFPPPFTQNECQELLGLLRSFAHWRQHHFRPHKALPAESFGRHIRHTRSPGFLRTAADALLTCLLLGVPYLFYTRGNYHPSDAEGGTAGRSLLPVLLVGACTCLLAAVLLSASVTFLSLPGLHSVARVVALVVVLLAAGSMASGLVALFRYKSELAGPVVASTEYLNPARVGREGLMLISTRSVIMSLPLVLLIYAVIGFVAAIVLYSFLGVDAGTVRFVDYTRWAVLGVLGGLAGVLTMSVVLLRR